LCDGLARSRRDLETAVDNTLAQEVIALELPTLA
jgi:hypothetical protein